MNISYRFRNLMYCARTCNVRKSTMRVTRIKNERLKFITSHADTGCTCDAMLNNIVINLQS